MYDYQIAIEGDGGEFCLGSITDKAGDYWREHAKDEFLSHLNNPDSCADEMVEKGVNLPLWHENNDFAHEYGIESVERITVFEQASRSRVVADDGAPEWAAMRRGCELTTSKHFQDHRGYVLFSRSYEKGSCIIDLSVDEPFDSSKFEIREVEFWDHSLIVGFSYAGEELSLSETFGRPYADNNCLLKGPDGSLYFESE